ncbi:retrovirus-related pol polyprotein from transposon TNT 1-94 [Tanacetum coccineum]
MFPSTSSLLYHLLKLVQRSSQVLEHRSCLPLVLRHVCTIRKSSTIRPRGNLSASYGAKGSPMVVMEDKSLKRCGSSSRTTTPYYVTHPSSVVDYDDDYQGDVVQNNSDDPLTYAMIWLARDRVNIQSRNFGNDGRNTRRSHVQEEVIEGTNVQNDAGNTQRTLQTSSLQELLQNYIVTTVVRKVEFLGMVIWKFLFAQQHDMYELEGDYLLTGAREYNLYTISILDMATSSPVCLMSKATLTKSWLWHRRLSHLNFGFIDDSSNNSMNTLSKEDLDDLFEAMYDEYFKKKSSDMPIHSAA